MPSGSNFLLFRNNGSGGYNASFQATSVPEPSSWILLGAGLLLAARFHPSTRPWA